jgi:hypothetical protein
LAFADGAIFFTFASFFGFVALRANNLLESHFCLWVRDYLRDERAARERMGGDLEMVTGGCEEVDAA